MRFIEANFEGAFLQEVHWVDTFQEILWPPGGINKLFGLSWDQVKDIKPSAMSRENFFGQWENVFSSVGNHSDTRQIRLDRRRSLLKVIAIGVVIGFGAEVGLFSLLYGWWFRNGKNPSASRWWRGREGWLLFWVKIVAFCADVSTPGIDPMSYKWKERAGFPVESVPIAVAIQRLCGWVVLALAGAVVVAFIIE